MFTTDRIGFSVDYKGIIKSSEKFFNQSHCPDIVGVIVVSFEITFFFFFPVINVVMFSLYPCDQTFQAAGIVGVRL
jgi:hypothetical protein